MEGTNIVKFPGGESLRTGTPRPKIKANEEIGLESIVETLERFRQTEKFAEIEEKNQTINKKGRFYQNTYDQIQRENEELGTLLIKLVNVSNSKLYNHTTYYVALYNWIMVQVDLASP